MKSPYDDPLVSKIDSIFFPHLRERSIHLTKSGNKLAYYTSAATAVAILENREVWMRNVSLMNDYSEVQHGMACLKRAYDSQEHGALFRSTLDRIFPRFTQQLTGLFNSWMGDMRHNTYVTCVSEHPATEDPNGRLSMWRAYGYPTGVALIFKPEAIFLPSKPINVHASPVAYWSEDRFADEFRKIGETIAREADFVRELGQTRVNDLVFSMLRFAALCTKHPGFMEEQEWRIIASPRMYRSAHLEESIEVISGVPQKVMRFPLRNNMERNVSGLEIHELLESVIIGPCESPMVIKEAFVVLLKQLGVTDSDKKVVASRIPLRGRI